jgi:glycosyltransferase involved in cell wall biosynthesis
MKVLFSNSMPFFLAHGGAQTLTEQLMRGLRNIGIEVEPERWWDENQTGDVLHYIGRPFKSNVLLAKKKGFKVVLTDLLDTVAARSRPKLFLQSTIIRTIQRFAPSMTERVAWDVYREVDAMIFALNHESNIAQYLFQARPERCHVIPWGMQSEGMVELAKRDEAEGDFLISIASIVPRKNTVHLAQAARDAQVPIVFVGKPLSEADEYFREFKALVDGKFVRYAGFVSEEEKYRLLKTARGFALLSWGESGCVAVYEAAAAGLPLFLTDAPWARDGYPSADPIVFVNPDDHSGTVRTLKKFYGSAHRLPRTTFPLFSWDQVAGKYAALYRQILNRGPS